MPSDTTQHSAHHEDGAAAEAHQEDCADDPRPASGRFVLRIDPALHASLRDAARRADTSLNRYCAAKLASPAPPLDPALAEVIRRAESILGDSLLGVVAFGSWARGESGPESDLDVLLVTDDRIAIKRALYRRWHAAPNLEWDGHRVEPHFVRLPAPGADVSSLWADVSMDGIVFFERGLALSRWLVRARQQIRNGRITAHTANGQHYWVHEGARSVKILELAVDHLRRAKLRLGALDALFAGGAWADVVRESQEIVELTLNGVLRSCGISPRRSHDLSGMILKHRDVLPPELQCHAEWLAATSRRLSRDHDLAFYGTENLIPSDCCAKEGSAQARAAARRAVALVHPHLVK